MSEAFDKLSPEGRMQKIKQHLATGHPVPGPWVEWLLATEIERLRAKLAEAEELANRSLRRLVELSEPGFLGALAARDVAVARAEAVEKRLAEIEAASEKAYGILWRDTPRGSVEKSVAARKELLNVITKEGQKRGIDHAISIYGPTSEHEILAAAEWMEKGDE